MDMGTQHAYQRSRSVMVEEDHMVNRVECSDKSHSVALAVDWSTLPFKPLGTTIAVYTNNKNITKSFCLAQELYMSSMEDIEDVVGEDNRATGKPLSIKLHGKSR